MLRHLDSHEPSDSWPHRIAELQELGLQLGEFYQGQGALWRTEEWLVTRWQLSSLAAGYGHSFLLHPAWLTAALLMPVGEAAMVQRGIPLVSEVASCRVWRPGVAIDYAAIPLPGSQDRFDLLLLAADGQLVASLEGCVVSWVQNGADFLGRSGPAAVGPGLDRLSDSLGAGFSRPVTFTSADPMLRDHRVRSLGVVPGGYFLTMLLAAGAAGAPARSRSQWRDVRFLAPAVVDRDPLTVMLQTGGQGAEGEIFQIVDSAGQVFCRATHGGPAKPAPALLEQAPELTAQTMAAATVYDAIALRQFFLARGLDYGFSCQCLTQVTVLQDWAWGEVRETGGEDWAIVDAAFQVAAALLANGANPVGALPQPADSLNSRDLQREPKPAPPLEPLLVPYGIDACWLDGSLVDVRRIGVRCTHRRSRGGQFDLMGLDRHGNRVFLIQGGRLQMAQWQPAQGQQSAAPEPPRPDREPPSEPIDQEPLRWFQPQWRPCPAPNLASETVLEEAGWGLLCSAQGPVPAVIHEAAMLAHRGQVLEQWPDRPDSAPTITTVWYWPAIGEEGPILLWRFLKTLQERFPSPTPLALRVITMGAAAVEPTETPQPDAAAIVGLLHSLAAESPHWQMGHVDVNETWLANGQASSLLAALTINLSATSQRCELALRSSGLYRRDLVAIPVPPTPATPSPLPLRPGGVYVIAGGAGGIGAALAQRWAARIPGLRLALLGRRPLDAAIQELLQALITAGATAIYEAVDITDAAAIESLFATLRSRYGAIHGVIHSALVLRDGLLAQMSETDFQVAFGVKAAGIRALAQATVLDRLDFFACFSSLNSFLGNAGQGNYVAGCAYQDAYMTQMQRQRPAVHWVVCNWGYWGESGRVTAPMYRKRLQRLGIGAIGTEEGLAAFEQLLASHATQVAIFRGTDALCDRLGCVARSPEVSEPDPIAKGRSSPAEVTTAAAIEAFLQGFAALDQLAIAGLRQIATRLPAQAVIPSLQRLYEHLGTLPPTAWEAQDPAAQSYRLRQQAQQAPGVGPWLALLDRCLQHYESVLRGEAIAPEVLFPGGSSALVEAVYQGNPPADHFSYQMATRIQQRMQQQDGPLRVLEVGAGTGASTTAILRQLQGQTDRLDYWFTDISPTLVRSAAKRLGPTYPPLQFHTLDLEQPIDPDLLNAFDVVAATNVIHATRNIHHSLTQLGQLLRPGGLLLLNELTQSSPLLTATFGLMPGWWLFVDETERIAGSPLLTADRWQLYLTATGFGAVEISQLPANPVYGQALLSAEKSPSALPTSPPVTMAAPPAPDRPEIASALSSPIAPSTANPVTQPAVNISALEVQIRGLVADCLEVAPEEIEAEGRFADYGLDSISAVDLIRSVNQAFGLELRTTVLFDYPTARSLAQHLQTLPNLQAPLESIPAAVAPPNLAISNPLAAPTASVSPVAPTLPSLDGLETQVRGLVADCLEIAPEEIEAEGRFADYGLDSISAVDLIRSVNQAFGLELRTTVLFDYPTVRSLAQHLQALLPMAVAPTADPVASQSNFTQPNPETRPAAGSPIAPPRPDNGPPVSVPSPTPDRPRTARSTAAAIPDVDFSSLTFPRAVWLTQPGSVAQVQWRSQPITPPAADQVQIAVRAAALNFGDLLCIKGLYPTMPSYPMTPGFEVSGEIIALGANVQNFQVGDQVMALLGESLGGLAEIVNADAVLAVRKPATVSHETAAAFPVTWLTAHQAIERARLQPGERILIQTAAGATGLHAVRMALAIGAEVFATAGSAHKLDYLRQVGVHHAIAYRELDFQTEVMRLSEGRGVDVVINTLAGDAIPKGLRCLAPGGRYVELAMTAWKTSAALDLSTLVDNQSVLSLDLRRWFLRRSPEVPLALEDMAGPGLEAGEGMVDRTFSLAEVRSAWPTWKVGKASARW
ncbi:MAG: SDR family oxidoreductase [Limnothrix sp. BL-A-16]